MADKNNHLVILAGGIGSRLWPLSTLDKPKQFVDILGCGSTMLQLTFDRFNGIIPQENVWVVTTKDYVTMVKEQLPSLSEMNILCEPVRRNTAASIAYASWRIKSINPKANVVVSPSDHIVLNVTEFRRVIESTLKFASETDSIITLGMKPNRPETGYGYIQADLAYATPRNREIYRVDQFHEKPDQLTAEKYITKNNYFWNSGIFVWNISTIVNAFRVYDPTMSDCFEHLLSYYGTPQEQEKINEVYPSCENISIDYSIIEKAEEVFVFPASFGWSDLGTWHSLHNSTEIDAYNNSLTGNNIQVFDSSNCIIHTPDEKKVVVQGLDGFIVSEKDDTLLICKINEEHRLKPIIED